MLDLIKKALVWFIQRGIHLSSSRKLDKIYSSMGRPKMAAKMYKSFRSRWKDFGYSANPRYLEVYGGVNGRYSNEYIPENIYYSIVEPALNNRIYAPAYSDKNFYEKFMADYTGYFPKTLIRGTNGVHYDQNYNPIHINLSELSRILDPAKDYIIKPAVDTSGGSNFQLFKTPKDSKYLISFYENIYQKILSYHHNFVFQERIISSDWFKSFNESSLNTIRFFTYRSVKTNLVMVSSSVLRFGRPGSIVDNQAAGGLTCGISKEGILAKYAIDKMGTKYDNIAAVNKYGGETVPLFYKMKDLVQEMALLFQYHRLLGFDVTVDNHDNIKVLEINCKNIEINFLQMNNGPLFDVENQEIIQYVSTHKPIFTKHLKV